MGRLKKPYNEAGLNDALSKGVERDMVEEVIALWLIFNLNKETATECVYQKYAHERLHASDLASLVTKNKYDYCGDQDLLAAILTKEVQLGSKLFEVAKISNRPSLLRWRRAYTGQPYNARARPRIAPSTYRLNRIFSKRYPCKAQPRHSKMSLKGLMYFYKYFNSAFIETFNSRAQKEILQVFKDILYDVHNRRAFSDSSHRLFKLSKNELDMLESFIGGLADFGDNTPAMAGLYMGTFRRWQKWRNKKDPGDIAERFQGYISKEDYKLDHDKTLADTRQSLAKP